MPTACTGPGGYSLLKSRKHTDPLLFSPDHDVHDRVHKSSRREELTKTASEKGEDRRSKTFLATLPRHIHVDGV